MRFRYTGAITLLSVMMLGACSSPPPSREERARAANTPSGKLGQAAYKATVQAEKAGQVIGRKLDTAAHNAHEGWKEAARKNQQGRK